MTASPEWMTRATGVDAVKASAVLGLMTVIETEFVSSGSQIFVVLAAVQTVTSLPPNRASRPWPTTVMVSGPAVENDVLQVTDQVSPGSSLPSEFPSPAGSATQGLHCPLWTKPPVGAVSVSVPSFFSYAVNVTD